VSFIACRINSGDWGRAPTNDGPTPSLLASRWLHTESSFFIMPRIRDPIVQNKVRIVSFAPVVSGSFLGGHVVFARVFIEPDTSCMDTYGRWRCVRETCHFLAPFSENLHVRGCQRQESLLCSLWPFSNEICLNVTVMTSLLYFLVFSSLADFDASSPFCFHHPFCFSLDRPLSFFQLTASRIVLDEILFQGIFCVRILWNVWTELG